VGSHLLHLSARFGWQSSRDFFSTSREFLLTNPLFLNLHTIMVQFLKIRIYRCVQRLSCKQTAAYFVAFQNVLVDTIALTDPGMHFPDRVVDAQVAVSHSARSHNHVQN
jgi:hypothetical protein